jgi:Na+-transporting NADH:ubiquinone oxidoreductase subunit D
VLDALGHAMGYSLVLILVATLRELFGSGTLLGYRILPLVRDGGWYEPNGLMLLAPSAFFIIGLLIWAVRSWKPVQVEKPEYRINVVHRTGNV